MEQISTATVLPGSESSGFFSQLKALLNSGNVVTRKKKKMQFYFTFLKQLLGKTENLFCDTVAYFVLCSHFTGQNPSMKRKMTPSVIICVELSVCPYECVLCSMPCLFCARPSRHRVSTGLQRVVRYTGATY